MADRYLVSVRRGYGPTCTITKAAVPDPAGPGDWRVEHVPVFTPVLPANAEQMDRTVVVHEKVAMLLKVIAVGITLTAMYWVTKLFAASGVLVPSLDLEKFANLLFCSLLGAMLNEVYMIN